MSTYKEGEYAAEEEIKQNGFDLDLWNEFLEHPEDFVSYSSSLLQQATPEFIQGYRSYYSSYALWADTKEYRSNLPSWRTPWRTIKTSVLKKWTDD